MNLAYRLLGLGLGFITSMISRREAILRRVFGAKLFEIIIRIPTVAISSFAAYFIPATSSTVATVSPFGPLMSTLMPKYHIKSYFQHKISLVSHKRPGISNLSKVSLAFWARSVQFWDTRDEK